MDELDDFLLGGKKPKKPVKPSVDTAVPQTGAMPPRITIHRPAVESDASFRDFFVKHGFKVNRTYGRAINSGSPHTYGGAADLSIHGKSPDDIYRLMEAALLRGYRVFDERLPAPGVKQTGPHIHVENAKTRLVKQSRFVPIGLSAQQIARLRELDNIRLNRRSSQTADPLDSFLLSGNDDNAITPQSFMPPVEVPEVNMTGGEAVPLQLATPATVGKLGIVPANESALRDPSAQLPKAESLTVPSESPQVPVPEKPETVAAQRSAANDPNSTRIGVQYTAGEKPGLRAKNETDIKLADGSTLRVNTGKFLRHSLENGIKRADVENGTADVTQFLGGKAEPSADTANKPAVVTRDAETGNELVASTVDHPEAVPVEAGLQKAQFPDKDTETTVTSSDAVNEQRFAPTTDADYQQHVDFERSEGREPMSREEFDKAAASFGSGTNADVNLDDPAAWNAEIEKQKEEEDLSPDLLDYQQYFRTEVEAGRKPMSRDDFIVSKGSAGTFDIDLANKPKGENAGRFLVRSALEQIAPEYQFRPSDIDNAVNYLKETNGRYSGSSDELSDEYIDSVKDEAGHAVKPFVVTNSLLNWMLNRRDGIEGDAPHKDLLAKVAMQNAQMDRGPAVSRRDFGYLPEGEAEEKLTNRIGEWDYAAQQVAADRLNGLASDPWTYVFAPVAMGKQAYKDLTDPVRVDDDWVREEKDRLLKQEGSYGKAWQKEQMYQNADLLEKSVRVVAQTGRSFLKNIVSGTGKGVMFVGQLLEDTNPINKLLPDGLKIGTRTASNAVDLFTRFLTAPDAQTAIDGWKQTYAAGNGPIKDQQVFRAMQSFDEAVGEDPMLKGRLLGALSDAQGSALAFMATGLLTPELSISTKLGQFGVTPALWGALSQAGTGYEEGTQSGLDENKARAYGVIQGLLGATEGFGIGGQIGELVKNGAIRGQLAEGILEVAKKGILAEGGEEFLQEMVQTTGGKIALDYLKDNEPSTYTKVINLFKRLPKQVTQTVTNEGLIAFMTGGLTGGVSHTANLALQEKPGSERNAAGSLEVGSKVTLPDGREGVIVEDRGKRVLVDYNGTTDKNGETKYESRAVFGKNKLSPYEGIETGETEAPATQSETTVTGESATAAAYDAATSPTNDRPEPTQAQKEAGNYVKGHILINGLDISVENPVGSERSGTDRDGKKWSVKMKQHYGYIKRTVGADEEHVDVFVKDDVPGDYEGPVFVVDQVHPDTGKFDEHKVMLGFSSEKEAREAYASNYAKDWKGLKSITEMPMPLFKAWLSEPVTEPTAKVFPKDEKASPRREFFRPAEDLEGSSPKTKSTSRREFFSKPDTVSTRDDRAHHEITAEEFNSRYPDEKDGVKVTARDGNTYEVNQGVKGKWIIRGTVNDRTRVFKNKKDMREFLHGDATHKRAVGKAVREGKAVDPNILRQYPEIERRVNKESADRIFRFQADERASEILGEIAAKGKAKVDTAELSKLSQKYDVSEKEVENLVNNADTAHRRRAARGAGSREEGSRPATKKTLAGKAVKVDIAGSEKSYGATYELREAEDVHPSHNPFNFNPNEEYFYKNDRHYDKGGEYAANVIQRSMPNKFKPSEVVNNAPTAELGAPVVDIDGNVLGGNSRAMMIHRIYGSENPKARDNYLAKLRDDAPAFGFAAEDIDKFDHPVLVRKVTDRGYDKQTAITDLNKVSVTHLTQSEQAIAEGGNLTPDALDFIIGKAKLSGSDATIADVLNRHGEDIVDELVKENIFAQGERNSLLKDGEITQAGKDRISKMLVGHVFEDLEQMQYLPDGYRNAVQRAVIPLLKTEKNDEWNLIPSTREALDLLTEHQAKAGKQSLDVFSGQASAIRPEGWSPKAVAIAKTIKSGAAATADAFNVYAGEFRNADEGSMFGALSPDEAFDTAFSADGRNAPLMHRGEAAAPTFYSQAEKVIEEKMPNKASALMVRNLLSAKNGVKQEEVDWLGIVDWLRDNPKPTKAEVLDFIRANNVDVREVVKGDAGYADPSFPRGWDVSNDTKFGEYRLPGGENYRELLLTIPDQSEMQDAYAVEIRNGERSYGLFPTLDEASAKAAEVSKSVYPERVTVRKIPASQPVGREKNYYSSHWSEPNILTHVRFDDRDGGKTLHIAEIQSDWHQQGREKGYSGQKKWVVFDTRLGTPPKDMEIARFDSEAEAKKKASQNPLWDYDTEDNVDGVVGKVPDAPFKKTWHELAMKRMIRYAAENGYERITWDTGATQTERFNLANQIDQIKWRKVSADGYQVDVYKDGEDISGIVQLPLVASASQVRDLLGKDIAEKITNSTERSGKLEGDGLKISSTGMTGFYDKMLPAFVNKYTKKWGGKVESDGILDLSKYTSTLSDPFITGDDRSGYKLNATSLGDKEPHLLAEYKTRAEAESDLASIGAEKTPVHSLTITQPMVDSVLTVGQPLYKARDEEGMNLLYKILPNASHSVILDGMSAGKFNSTNDLEFNEYDAEMFRQLLREMDWYHTRIETEPPAFEGITVDTGDLRDIATLGRDLSKQLARNGYSDSQIETFDRFVENIDELAKRNDKAGVAFVFDEALPEEKFHQEDMNAGRTDAQAIAELIKSVFWSFGGKFEKLYAGISDADKASEIAAKLYTGQAEAYGWDQISDFENAKEAFLKEWFDGILRNNSDTIAEVGADEFLKDFERLKTLYAKTQETDAGRGTKSQRGQSFDRGPAEPDDREGDDPREEESGVGGSSEDTAQAGSETRVLPTGQESLKQEKQEADALDTTPQEVRAKNRQFASTLRDNGRDALDVPFIPGTDAERIDEVKKILAESREKADEAIVPYGDYEHALDIFEDKDTDGRTRTALGIALIDHLGSAGEYAQMLRVAEMVTTHVGEAAQALQAATLVSKYDFAGGVRLAQKALEKNGKTLSDDDIEEIRRLTEQYAESEEQRAILEYSLAEARDAVKQLETENAEIAEVLGEQADELIEKNKLIKNLKLQVERWKNGVLSRSQARSRVSKAHQELIDRRGAIVAKINQAFPQSAPKVLRSTSEETDGRNVAPEKFDDETRKAIVELTALDIFDNVPFEDALRKISDITGGVLNDDEIRSVHADAVDMTRGESHATSAEMLTKMKIRNEHRKQADQFRNKKATGGSRLFKNPNLNRLDREILHVAGGDDALGVGAVLLNQVGNKKEWYDTIGSFYPDLKGKELDSLFTRSWKVKNDAKEALRKLRAENDLAIKMSEADFEKLEQQKYIARGVAIKNRKTLDNHYKALQKSLAEKVADTALDVASIPKSTMAGFDISYPFRQGFLPMVLFTKDGAKGLEGVLRGLQSEETRLVYAEKLREQPRFNESQVMGVEYGEIGDNPVFDEHFSSRIFEKGENVENPAGNRLGGAAIGAGIGAVAGGPVGAAIGATVGAAAGVRGISKFQRKSEFAYTLPGDAQRFLVYDRLAGLVDSQTHLTAIEKKAAKQFAAKIANRMTGRGDIRGIFNPSGYFGKFLNTIGFSPKFVASRFQAGFWLSPVALPFVPKGMRMTMAKKQVRFNAVMLFLAAICAFGFDRPDDDDERNPYDVFDPASKNFMRGRIRGTDYKVDLTANMSEPMRLFYANAIGSGYYAATGQWHKLDDIWKQEYERYVVTEEGSPLRFFRGKLSPVGSYVIDAATGKDYLGRDFDAMTAAKQRFWPLVYQQAYDGLVYDRAETLMKEPMKDQSDAAYQRFKSGQVDWKKMLAILVPSAAGFNIQQYAETEQSRAEQKAWDMWERGYPDKRTDEQKRVDGGLRKLFRLRQEIERNGSDASAVTKAIETYAAKYGKDSADLKKIESQATGSRFEFVTDNFTPAQLQTLIDEYATDREKPELEKILAAKQEKEARPLSEKLKSGSTDDVVKKYKLGSLTPEQVEELKVILRRKAQNASEGGTLTADEVQNIKTVIPDFNMAPSPPKLPKAPKFPTANTP